MKPPSRRRFFGLASSALCSMIPACSRTANYWQWSGVVFGTDSRVVFSPPDDLDPAELSQELGREVRRIEQILTLYQGNSPLRRLNESGVLPSPPMELLQILNAANELHSLTGGAFDVTVQPLWEVYQEHYRKNPKKSAGPPKLLLKAAREKVGFAQVHFSEAEIRYQLPGMAMTLNGLAQGFLCDHAAQFLEAHGVRHGLVQLGEYRAIGSQADGQPWQIGIANPVSGKEEVLGSVELVGNGLATSSGQGFIFDAEAGIHHLFHPSEAEFSDVETIVSVRAANATLADGLATAGVVMNRESFERSLAGFPGARCWIH